MSQYDTHIAVITGDLVASTTLGAKKIEHAFATLEACAKVQANWHGASLSFTRHRGDGWQVVLARPDRTLRSVLAFRAALKALGDEYDSRMGIAEGTLTTDLPSNLNAATDPVFAMSGETLEELKSTHGPVRLAHASKGQRNAVIILAGQISSGWTAAQSQAILPTLDPDWDGYHTSIARSLGKSRQAVAKALAAAGHDHIELAIETIETVATNA